MWSRPALRLDTEIRCWKLVQSNSIWLMSMLNLWSHMNRSHGASESWCHDLKAILIVGLKLGLIAFYQIWKCARPMRFHQITDIKKNEHKEIDLIRIYDGVLSQFNCGPCHDSIVRYVCLDTRCLDTKIIFEMWNKRK